MAHSMRRLTHAAILALVVLLFSGAVQHALAALTSAQVTATTAFLEAFRTSIPSLATAWATPGYCNWDGVSCDADGFVSVNLNSKSLVGAVPPLPNGVNGFQVMVVSIDMSNNPSIVSSFQDSWAGLTNLRSLDLSSTGLFGAIPDSWNGMTSLQTVKISNTNACMGLPNWNIASLRTVDLSNNKLRGSLANSWGPMVGLTSVDITGNSFCGCMPSTWTSTVLVNAATAANSELVAATCHSTRFCTDADYVCDTQTTTTSTTTTTTTTTGAPVLCYVEHCITCKTGLPNWCSECETGYNRRNDGSCMISGYCEVQHCTQCSPTDYTLCQICNSGYEPTASGTCVRVTSGAASPASLFAAVAAVVATVMAVVY